MKACPPRRAAPLVACLLAEYAAGFTVVQDNVAVVKEIDPESAIDYVKAHDYAAYDIFEMAPREIKAMEAWATRNGVERAEGLKLVEEARGREELPSQEVYAATTADVAAGSPVLFVPEHLVLSSDKAIAELRSDDMLEAERFVVSKGGAEESRRWYLMLKVLAEIQRGTDSPWFAWLNAMPRYYSNAAAMTDFCLQCLPPLMRRLAGEEREKRHRLSRESMDLVPFLCDELKAHPRDFCLWAYQVRWHNCCGRLPSRRRFLAGSNSCPEPDRVHPWRGDSRRQHTDRAPGRLLQPRLGLHRD